MDAAGAPDWTVRTRMDRIAPREGGFSVEVPLLPGEKVLTPGPTTGPPVQDTRYRLMSAITKG